MSLLSLHTEEDEEAELQSEGDDRRVNTPARETSSEQMDESFDFTPPTLIGQGRPKLTGNRSPKLPGASNLKLHVDKMTE